MKKSKIWTAPCLILCMLGFTIGSSVLFFGCQKDQVMNPLPLIVALPTGLWRGSFTNSETPEAEPRKISFQFNRDFTVLCVTDTGTAQDVSTGRWDIVKDSLILKTKVVYGNQPAVGSQHIYQGQYDLKTGLLSVGKWKRLPSDTGYTAASGSFEIKRSD